MSRQARPDHKGLFKSAPWVLLWGHTTRAGSFLEKAKSQMVSKTLPGTGHYPPFTGQVSVECDMGTAAYFVGPTE